MGAFRNLMEREMRLAGFRPNTVEAYATRVRDLVRRSKVSPDALTGEHVRAYLSGLAEAGRSASTINQSIAGTRFFFAHVIHREFPAGIEYQRGPWKLPVTLNREEVRRILDATTSLRDRALLETAYAAGLRLSEVVHLRVSDIDSERMVIRVADGKEGGTAR